MDEPIESAPILSTPDTHIFNEITPTSHSEAAKDLSDDLFSIRYEIRRSIQEIRSNRWSRVALQFPDNMLSDSARVFQMLARGTNLQHMTKAVPITERPCKSDLECQSLDKDLTKLSLDVEKPVKFTILADTSYGSCCVDEIAAEHMEADAVIHYGRACLSPTVRLPVLYVFTQQELNREHVVRSFQKAFPDVQSKVIVTADVPYDGHVKRICNTLRDEGYTSVFAASITRDPSSLVPNRSVPESVNMDPSTIGDWHLFHISDPPTSLLLTLSSSIRSVFIYPTSGNVDGGTPRSLESSTSQILRRRYALVTSLSTVAIWGILINTLSVKDYLQMVEHVKTQIAAAGKKSYLFVVGKLNAAKVANFSEIGGWVIIGCWESSLIDSKDFYKPVITPFELDLALQRDEDRLWTGQWRGDFQNILSNAERTTTEQRTAVTDTVGDEMSHENGMSPEYDSEEDSAPPEFDLRTGRYISQTRPMHPGHRNKASRGYQGATRSSTALTRRANGDIVSVNGIASPAAEFSKTRRTWQGLGSDLANRHGDAEMGDAIEEGRNGVARGYKVGDTERT